MMKANFAPSRRAAGRRGDAPPGRGAQGPTWNVGCAPVVRLDAERELRGGVQHLFGLLWAVVAGGRSDEGLGVPGADVHRGRCRLVLAWVGRDV